MVAALKNIHRGSDLHETGGSVLVIGNNSCWRASAPVAELIASLKRSGSREEYVAQLAGLGCADAQAIVSKLELLGVLCPERSIAAGAWAFLKEPLIPIIRGRWLRRALPNRFVDAAFSPVAVASCAIIFLAIAIHLSFGKASSNGAMAWGSLTPLWIVIGILAHEIGHSAACAWSGIGFRPIGLTWYIVWPVAYTNVSGMEIAARRQRIAINLGGIYFQMAAMIVLFAFELAWPALGCGAAIRPLNILLLFNLNPFIRSDGYWCAKDLSDSLLVRMPGRLADALYRIGFVLFTLYLTWRVGVRLIHMMPGSMDEISTRLHAATLGQAFSFAILAYMQLLIARGIWRRLSEALGCFTSRREVRQLSHHSTVL